MESIEVDGISVLYPPAEQATADCIAGACTRAVDLARDLWRLPPPSGCRIYVMTSWQGFVFESAPWPWRLLLASAWPFWAPRVRRTWPYSAAWTQNYGRRIAIGIKPSRLLQQVPEGARVRLSVTIDDPQEKVAQVTCHELTHACAAHLHLPMWLNEGIAVVTVDRFAGRMMIVPDTLAYLQEPDLQAAPLTYRRLARLDINAIGRHFARAYWLVRYLEDAHPGFLRGLFARSGRAPSLEPALAAELQVAPQRLWAEMNRLAYEHFAMSASQ